VVLSKKGQRSEVVEGAIGVVQSRNSLVLSSAMTPRGQDTFGKESQIMTYLDYSTITSFILTIQSRHRTEDGLQTKVIG